MTNDLEARLTASLAATADDVEPGPAPAFSWQQSDRQLQPRRSGRRRTIGAAGAIAAVAAAAVVATVLSGDPSTGSTGTPVAEPSRSESARTPAPVTQSASALLLTAAHTRLRTGDLVLADGQFRYIRTLSPGTPTYIGGKKIPPRAGAYGLDELWIPKDQTDVWMRRSTEHGSVLPNRPEVWTGKCGDLYANAQDGPKGDPCDRPGSFDDPTPAFIAALPRDSDALYEKLRRYAKGRLNPEKDHNVNSVVFTTVSDLLDSGMLGPVQTSTAYAVLSRIPGVTAVPDVANLAGVRGTGFRLTHSFGRKDELTVTTTLIVDLQSGAYLGDREDGPDEHHISAVTVGVADTIGHPAN